jgi:threonine synthase
MSEHGWYPASNYTDIPTNGAFGHEGYKTIAYEIHEALDGSPDLISIPAALGEGLFGIWKGFDELARLGRLEETPRMVACEPAGGPLRLAMRDPSRPLARVPRAETVARGIGGAVNSFVSVAALRASHGMVAQADDEAILAARRSLAAEGLFVEPASAAALAGLRNLALSGDLPPGLRIVLVNTSSGLKNLQVPTPI